MRRVRLAFAPLCALVAVACEPIIGPEVTLPPDAVQTEPLAAYSEWYGEVEACTGVTGSYDVIRWFEVPYANWWDPVWEQYAIGTWRAPHDIYIATAHVENEDVVKHEMVHDLLQGGATYDLRFGECSGIVHP